MDREIKIANRIYAAVTVIFTAALLAGAYYLPQSFYV